MVARGEGEKIRHILILETMNIVAIRNVLKSKRIKLIFVGIGCIDSMCQSYAVEWLDVLMLQIVTTLDRVRTAEGTRGKAGS